MGIKLKENKNQKRKDLKRLQVCLREIKKVKDLKKRLNQT